MAGVPGVVEDAVECGLVYGVGGCVAEGLDFGFEGFEGCGGGDESVLGGLFV